MADDANSSNTAIVAIIIIAIAAILFLFFYQPWGNKTGTGTGTPTIIEKKSVNVEAPSVPSPNRR